LAAGWSSGSDELTLGASSGMEAFSFDSLEHARLQCA
jgi:hypothetical protein